MKESQELEVFKDRLILNLRHKEQPSEWEQVARQDVKEWIGRRVIFGEIGEPDDSGSTKAEYDEEVQNVHDVVEAGAINI